MQQQLASIDVQNMSDIVSIEMVVPPKETLGALLASVNIGHVKGVNSQLDTLEEADEAYKGFVDRMRELTVQFKINEMKQLLKEMME